MFLILLLAAASLRLPVDGGVYLPLYPPSPTEKTIPVASFRMDRTPVTNGEYLSFVGEHPEWQRGRVGRLLADSGYLASWKSALETGLDPEAPVTGVSWFAARSYCEAHGGRLPTEAEWELAATASETSRDGSGDPAFAAQILEWYAAPTPAKLPPVGRGKPNFWGLYDLHGLVWEWVEDFNSSMVSADNRDDKDGDRLRFCGNGGTGAASKEDYAAFMRVAFRSSLQATYTTSSLGFRCAEGR